MAKKTYLGSALDIKYLGNEPEYGENVLTDIELIKAYNWYSYVCDRADVKKFVIEYFKTSKAGKNIIEALNRFPEQRYTSTLGWICRILSNGGKIPQETSDFMKKKSKELVEAATAFRNEKEAEQKAKTVVNPATTIRSRIAEQVSNLIGDIEVEVDAWPKTDFKASEYLRKKDVKALQSNTIADYYEKLNTELKQAILGKDEQLKEAYAGWKKSALKKFQEFIEGIISDCRQTAANSKAARKPRSKKVKSAEQIAAKVKYLKRDDKLNITSANPAGIVRAQNVWVYNVKTRKLAQYVAKAGGGLNIKGTTILDYDEKLSIQKKLRKPEQVLPSVVQAGKVALRRIMDSINAKPSPLNGRINGDTLIVKVTT